MKLFHTLPRVALLFSKVVMQDLQTPFNGDSSLILKWEASKPIPMLDDHPLSAFECNDGVHAVDDATCLGYLALPGVCYLEVHKVTSLEGDLALLLETVQFRHLGSLV